MVNELQKDLIEKEKEELQKEADRILNKVKILKEKEEWVKN